MDNFGIKNIGSNQLLHGISPAKAQEQASESFSNILTDAITSVNDVQVKASESVRNLSVGETGSIHQTMVDIEKASISFEMMMEVRNKVIDAYQEIMRMPV